MLYKLWPTSTFLTGLIVLMIPTFFSSYYSIKDKSTRKSLSFSMAISSSMLGWSLYNLGFYIMKEIYESVDAMPHLVFLIIPCVLYPFLRASVKLYKEVYLNSKTIYDLKTKM